MDIDNGIWLASIFAHERFVRINEINKLENYFKRFLVEPSKMNLTVIY